MPQVRREYIALALNGRGQNGLILTRARVVALGIRRAG